MRRVPAAYVARDVSGRYEEGAARTEEGPEAWVGISLTLTAGFLVKVPLSFLSPPAILSPRVAWRFWWWTFLRNRPRRWVVVWEAYLRVILLLVELVVLEVGLKDVKTSDVGILLGLERLL